MRKSTNSTDNLKSNNDHQYFSYANHSPMPFHKILERDCCSQANHILKRTIFNNMKQQQGIITIAFNCL